MSIGKKIAGLFQKLTAFMQDVEDLSGIDPARASPLVFPSAVKNLPPDTFAIEESPAVAAEVPEDPALPSYEARLVVYDDVSAPRLNPARPNYRLYICLNRKKDCTSTAPGQTHYFRIRETSDPAAVRNSITQWYTNEKNGTLEVLQRHMPHVRPDSWQIAGLKILRNDMPLLPLPGSPARDESFSPQGSLYRAGRTYYGDVRNDADSLGYSARMMANHHYAPQKGGGYTMVHDVYIRLGYHRADAEGLRSQFHNVVAFSTADEENVEAALARWDSDPGFVRLKIAGAFSDDRFPEMDMDKWDIPQPQKAPPPRFSPGET